MSPAGGKHSGFVVLRSDATSSLHANTANYWPDNEALAQELTIGSSPSCGGTYRRRRENSCLRDFAKRAERINDADINLDN
jgi:hypothetical protein